MTGVITKEFVYAAGFTIRTKNLHFMVYELYIPNIGFVLLRKCILSNVESIVGRWYMESSNKNLLPITEVETAGDVMKNIILLKIGIIIQ